MQVEKEKSESMNNVTAPESSSTPTEEITTEPSPDEAEADESSSDSDKEIIQENSDQKESMNPPQSSEFESYTEEELANIEIIEYEFEDPNMSIKDLSIFDKSLSMADLRDEHQEEVLRTPKF